MSSSYPINDLHILLAVHHYPPARVGGAELLAHRLARWLAQRDAEVRVVCVENLSTAPDAPLAWRDDEFEGIPVQRLTLPVRAASDARLLFSSPLLHAHFARLLREWQPDLVHLISGYLLGAAPLLAASACHIPTVVTLTDFWFLCPTIQLLRGDNSLCSGPTPIECARCLYDESRALRALDRRAPALVQSFWRFAAAHPAFGAPFDLPARLDILSARPRTLVPALNTADAIVSLTQFVADMHIANGVRADKVIAKPGFLDLTEFFPVHPTPRPPDEIRFAYVGQVAALKGVDLLLRAFRQLERANPDRQLKLDIHGKLNAEPEYTRALRQLAAPSSNITFHGAYEHRRALQLVADCDVVVVPSLWYENSPYVILESFAARRPVIGSNVGGIAEVVQHGKNGLLFERANAADLARVMQQIVDSPALLAELRAGIPTLRTLDEDMCDLLDIYARVLHMSRDEPITV